MYSLVLTAMLTASPAAPQWGHHGGYAAPVAVGYGTCIGAYGGGGAFGCAGGGYACVGCMGSGAASWSGYGYSGGFGYAGCWACYGCTGCHGCYGGYAAGAPVAPMAPAYAAAAPVSEPATVVVQLPADAKLFVEGQPVRIDPATGGFVTPRLERGEWYVYTLKIEAVRDGKVLAETKDIQVSAGQVTRVRFGDPGGERPASIVRGGQEDAVSKRR